MDAASKNLHDLVVVGGGTVGGSNAAVACMVVQVLFRASHFAPANCLQCRIRRLYVFRPG